MENKYQDIALNLEQKWWIILRWNDIKSNDLDVFVEKQYLQEVEKLLWEQGFTKTFQNKDYIYYKKFVLWDILFIDITLNLDYFLKNFWNITLTSDFQIEYLKNIDTYTVPMNILRYLYLFRKKEKYRKYFFDHKEEIIKNNFYNSYVTPSILKKDMNFSDLEGFLSKKISVLIKYFWVLWIIKLYFHTFKNKILNYRIGKIIVFLWIDWVWKSTIISQLEEKLWHKKIYFWEWTYRTKKISDKILSKTQNKLIILFFKFLLLFENILRIITAYIYKMRWWIVLLDRHPYFDWMSRWKNDFHLLFTKIFYQLFPKWDVVCILYNDPEVILKRKQEKTKSEIEKYYGILLNLEIKKSHKIKNDILQDTLNTIIKLMYAK